MSKGKRDQIWVKIIFLVWGFNDQGSVWEHKGFLNWLGLKLKCALEVFEQNVGIVIMLGRHIGAVINTRF